VGLTSAKRFIWVIRHGKSVDGLPSMRDFDRPLSERGARDGDRMRAWYAEQNQAAQWIWSSPAKRAVQTAEYVSRGFGADVVENSSLYLASAEQLLACLKSTPPDIQTVAIVGHNPGLTHLVNLLGQEMVTDNLVTFGSALFETHKSWDQLSFGVGRQIELVSPKLLP